jgi:hypothetical protein
MKLLEYLTGLNIYAANNNIQSINLEDDTIDLKIKDHYDIKINDNLFSIDVNSSLDKLKELLKKAKIFLIIDDGENETSIVKKFENKKISRLKLITVSEYQLISPFDDQKEQLGIDIKDIKKYTYVAFFDDKKLTGNQETLLLKLVSKK